MSLIVAGLDEAGYGPLLGPLCVGASVFRVRDWREGDRAPDLWARLASAVTTRPARTAAGPRIAVADSKALKLPNSSATRHPLLHLERGVLAFASILGLAPATDLDLFAALGTRLDGHACYDGPPAPVPVAHTQDQLAIAANTLRAALERADVEVLDLACQAVTEAEFNSIIAATANKSDTTLAGIGRHLHRFLRSTLAHSPADEPVRVVCDRLGGRERYAGVLETLVPGAVVRTIEESPVRSRYSLNVNGRTLVISFQPEGESAHLPVALASMVAKYTRELAMARFNRHFATLSPELKPTAGYWHDARRWLTDIGSVLTQADRDRLVRRA